jgi:hypothetical protein
MLTDPLPDQITELRWLVGELRLELDTLATTPYPGVHRFLMCNLAARIAKVAVQVRGSLTEYPHDQTLLSDSTQLFERPA